MEILPQLLVNALIAGSIYAVASSGLALTYGLLKVLNFAHGHLMMLGAYIFYFAHIEKNLDFVSALAFTSIVMAIVGALSLVLFVTPFQKLNSLLTLVTTLSLATILESLVSIVFGVNVKSLTTTIDVKSHEIYGIYITSVQAVIIVVALSILTGLAVLIHVTSFGRQVRALSESREAGEAIGINGRKIYCIIFLLGSLLAALSGVMVGYETNLQPTMGNVYTVKAFAAMILGGLGNIWGTVIGSYLLGLIENLSLGIDIRGVSLPAGYKDAFAFGVILFMLLIKPSGIMGQKGRTV